MKRILSAAVFLPGFWVIVKKFHPGVYEVLMTVAALLALRELYRLAAARGHRCHRLLGALVSVLVIASFAFARFDIRYALAFGLIALPLASLLRGGDWGPVMADIGKKTVEGAVGGVVGALLAAFVAKVWFINRLSVIDCVVLGVALGAIGILGDLVESMFKRGAGMKDIGALVPGHGGILDRVDSLLYAGPILYYYYLFAMRTH